MLPPVRCHTGLTRAPLSVVANSDCTAKSSYSTPVQLGLRLLIFSHHSNSSRRSHWLRPPITCSFSGVEHTGVNSISRVDLELTTRTGPTPDRSNTARPERECPHFSFSLVTRSAHSHWHSFDEFTSASISILLTSLLRSRAQQVTILRLL